MLPLDELAELPELAEDELPLSETPSAESVCVSSVPLALMPCCCWNCFSAARVLGPILPSAVTLMPLSLSACWAPRTVEAAVLPEEPLLLLIEDEPLLLPIDDDPLLLPIDDDPLLLLIDDVSLPEALLPDAPVDPDCDVPCANTAVLENISAARVSLRKSM